MMHSYTADSRLMGSQNLLRNCSEEDCSINGISIGSVSLIICYTHIIQSSSQNLLRILLLKRLVPSLEQVRIVCHSLFVTHRFWHDDTYRSFKYSLTTLPCVLVGRRPRACFLIVMHSHIADRAAHIKARRSPRAICNVSSQAMRRRRPRSTTPY